MIRSQIINLNVNVLNKTQLNSVIQNESEKTKKNLLLKFKKYKNISYDSKRMKIHFIYFDDLVRSFSC